MVILYAMQKCLSWVALLLLPVYIRTAVPLASLREVGRQSTDDTRDLWFGTYVPHPTGSLFFYSYNKPGRVTNKLLVVAYREDGSTPGQFEHGLSDGEGLYMVGSSRVIVFGLTKGYCSIQVQSITGSAVAMAIDGANTDKNQVHNRDQTGGVMDPSSTYIYAPQYKGLAWSISIGAFAALYKIDVSDLSVATRIQYATGTKTALYTLFLSSDDNLMVSSEDKFLIIQRATMQELRQVQSSKLTYWMTEEPTDKEIWYIGDRYTPIGLRRIRKARLKDYTGLESELLGLVVAAGGTFQTDFHRPKVFRWLVYHYQEQKIWATDIDNFNINHEMQIGKSASILKRTTFLMGRNEKKLTYFTSLDVANHKFFTLEVSFDFCEKVENPCTKCIAGRYLEEVGVLNNRCLKPEEFPLRYGPSGLTIDPCLGDLTSGCLRCPSSLSTCTECDNPAGFYLNTYAGDICQKIPQFPDTYGLDTVNKKVAPCTDTNCLKCQADHTKCTLCKTSFFLKQGTQSGCLANNIDKWGLKKTTTPHVLAPCTVTNCQKCFADMNKCTECSSGFYFKENVQNTCFENTADEYGLDTTLNPNLIKKCEDQNCKSCLADYKTCTSCKAPYYLSSSKICLLGEAGKGPDSNGNLVSCAVAHCSSCSTNYLLCDTCDASYYLKEGSMYQKVCLLNNQDYFGLKKSGSQTLIASCQEPNCKSCLSDYSKCSVCKPTYYPLESSPLTCSLNNLPGKGLKSVSGKQMIAPCADPNCKECFTSVSTCQLCKPNFFFRTDFETSIPACFRNNAEGWGMDLSQTSPQKLSKCTKPHCGDCFADHTKCLKCKTNWYKLPPSNDCKENTIAGMGPKELPSGEFILAPCELDLCLECFTGVQKCTKCKDNYVYDPSNTKKCVENNIDGWGRKEEFGYELLVECQDENCSDCKLSYNKCKRCRDSSMSLEMEICSLFHRKKMGLRVKHFSIKSNSFELIFSEDLLPNDFKNLKYSLLDKSGDNIPESQYTIHLYLSSSRKVKGHMKFEESTPPSTLMISHRDVGQGKSAFLSKIAEYDSSKTIEVKNVVYSKLMDESAMKTTRSAIRGVTLGATGLGGNSGHLTLFLKVIDTIEHMLFLNGIRMIRADHFLHMLNIDLLAILPNILKLPEEKLNCVPSENFYREDLTCSILNNAGSNISTVSCFGLLVLIFLGLNRLKKAIEGKITSKIIQGIVTLVLLPGKFFSVSIFVTLFDGNQIEMLRLCFLSFSTMKSNLYSSIDVVVAFVIFSLYIIYGWMLHIHIKTAFFKPRTTPRFGFLSEIFSGFKEKKDKNSKKIGDILHFYCPLVYLVKSLLSQLVVTITYRSGLAQIWFLVIIEILFCTYLIKYLTFKSQLANFGSILTSLFLVTIYGLMLGLNLESSKKITFPKREGVYSTVLITLYSLIIMLSFVPVVFQAFVTLFGFMKKGWNRIKYGKKESEGHPKIQVLPHAHGEKKAGFVKASNKIKPEKIIDRKVKLSPSPPFHGSLLTFSAKPQGMGSNKSLRITPPSQNGGSKRRLVVKKNSSIMLPEATDPLKPSLKAISSNEIKNELRSTFLGGKEYATSKFKGRNSAFKPKKPLISPRGIEHKRPIEAPVKYQNLLDGKEALPGFRKISHGDSGMQRKPASHTNLKIPKQKKTFKFSPSEVRGLSSSRISKDPLYQEGHTIEGITGTERSKNDSHPPF